MNEMKLGKGYHQNANGLWQKDPRPVKKTEPGAIRYWTKSARTAEGFYASEELRVTVVEDKGNWIIVQTEDGKTHRVRPHNVNRHPFYSHDEANEPPAPEWSA